MIDTSGLSKPTHPSAAKMSEMPLVTVSMAAFNAERYIAQAIESLLVQTYSNFELIIVDDGSTDRTREIINQFSDARIIKLFSDANRGLTTTRNHIASMAKGKYLALLDADDFAEPDRLASQVEFLENGYADLCGADHYTLNQVTGEIKKSKQRHSDANIRALLCVCSPVCNPAMMGKAEIFKRFPYQPQYTHAEDYCLWIDIALAGYRFANLKKKLITYRLHSSQTSVKHYQEARDVFLNAQSRYLTALGISEAYTPRALPFMQRIYYGAKFIKLINTRIPDISVAVSMELYARFQFRGNGLLTPFIRFERLCVSIYGSMLGKMNKK